MTAARSGVWVVDKPRGPTSHDVVAAARRVLGTRAVGHAGTLDPMASGVLVLLAGEATKLAPYLSGQDKEYVATVAFGRATDTLDAEGRTTAVADVSAAATSPAALAGALAAESARAQQVPPAVSAISVGGRRAHRLARSGQAPELPARPVSVRALELLDHDGASATIRLVVSKGYYVRAFARDLGEHLGVPAHLAALRRLASGSFRVELADPWPPPGAARLLAVEDAVRRVLPVVTLTDEGAERARQGKRLEPAHFDGTVPQPGASGWLCREGRLTAIGAPHPDGGYRVLRGFAPPEPASSSRHD